MEGRRGSYPAELRERAVRLVAESRQHHDSEWAAITPVAAKLGVMLPCRLLTLLSSVVVLWSWPVRGPNRWLRWRRISTFLSRVCVIGWPRPTPMNAGVRLD